MPNWLKQVFNTLAAVWVAVGAVVVWFSLFALKSAIVVRWISKETIKKFLGL